MILIQRMLLIALISVAGVSIYGKMLRAEQTDSKAVQQSQQQAAEKTVSSGTLPTSSKDPQWLADKARLKNLISEKLPEAEACQITWNILWSWAKKGNLEARATLSRVISPPLPIMPRLFIPGRSKDELSLLRDVAILGIHSIGVQYDEGTQQAAYSQNSDGIYSTIFSGNWPRGKSFLRCLETHEKQACADWAAGTGTVIDGKLVPTFEEYAAEIDALVMQGMKPRCINYRDARSGAERGRDLRKNKD